jgi:hypothetical protein
MRVMALAARSLANAKGTTDARHDADMSLAATTLRRVLATKHSRRSNELLPWREARA